MILTLKTTKLWLKTGLEFRLEFMAKSYLMMYFCGQIAILHLRVLSTTLRHSAMSRGILTARFKRHFREQNRTILRLNEIVNFFPNDVEI